MLGLKLIYQLEYKYIQVEVFRYNYMQYFDDRKIEGSLEIDG